MSGGFLLHAPELELDIFPASASFAIALDFDLCQADASIMRFLLGTLCSIGGRHRHAFDRFAVFVLDQANSQKTSSIRICLIAKLGNVSKAREEGFELGFGRKRIKTVYDNLFRRGGSDRRSLIVRIWFQGVLCDAKSPFRMNLDWYSLA